MLVDDKLVSEYAFIKHLITGIYPKGIVSLVSDSYDFWGVVTIVAKLLKPEILARDGKVVLRPDSGDPVKIVVGDPEAPTGSPEEKGAIQCLWDIFGGTVTETGHKLLDNHIGLIYGDSISLDRAERILEGLKQKGFASGNIVFGIGSYTYQFVTRDTFGSAIKATAGKVFGEFRQIFKDPKTDDGMKKSARGYLRVEYENGNYVLYDCQTEEQEQRGELTTAFLNGKMTKMYTLTEVRDRLLNTPR